MSGDVNHPDYQKHVFQLLRKADDEGLALGEAPKQRAFGNIQRTMTKLGFVGYVIAGPNRPPEVDLINALQKELFFRSEDIVGGAVHFGAFMWRDLFARFDVPIIFGTPAIKPFDHLDFSDGQKRLIAEDQDTVDTYEDQFFDVFDLSYGIMEAGSKKHVSVEAKHFLNLCHFQLEAAAGTLCRAYGFQGATQAALLSIELSLKAHLLNAGYSTAELAKRPYGHNLARLAEELKSIEPGFDSKLVLQCLETMPHYVGSRYDAEQPSRLESGEIVMKAQYVVAESVRQFGCRNIREEVAFTRPRQFPSL